MTDVRLPIDDEVEALALLIGGELDGEPQEEVEANEAAAAAELERLRSVDARRTLYGLLHQARRLTIEIEERAKYAQMIVDEVRRANTKPTAQVRWLEAQAQALAEELIAGSTKHVDVPGVARIQFRDLKEHLRIADPDAFIGALSADEKPGLVEVIEKLKVTDAKKYAQAVLERAGEIMPGVERVPEERRATVSYEAVLDG